MQDIHSIETSDGGRRLFAGGGDRRLRPNHHHHPHDLKCPRCDSLNTKFCYYNNYNLSQPRHFCKSCRRYWTKGGVLRNVPVGGGVRKTKRSSKPKSKTSIPSSKTVADERKTSISENSSSDSNTTTANTTATTIPTTTAEVSGSNSTNSNSTMLLNFNDSSNRFFNMPHSSTKITTIDPLTLNQPLAGSVSSQIGTFTSMVTSFEFQQQKTENVVQNHNSNQHQWTYMDVKMPEMMDRTDRRSNGGVAGTGNWHDNGDEGLFDLTGSLYQSYWNDNDGHNYLP